MESAGLDAVCAQLKVVPCWTSLMGACCVPVQQVRLTLIALKATRGMLGCLTLDEASCAALP